MIEIKFRAWDKKTNKMYDVASIDMFGAVVTLVECGEDVGVDFIDRPLSEVELRHYTGLLDKNDTKIFEGDILQRPTSVNSEYHGEWVRDQVIYKPGVFFVSHISSEKGNLPRGYTAGELLDSYFEYDGKLFAFADDYEPRCIGEVVGNIYENKELLNG